jgi:DNA-binding CsgD family transcriptional regulator
MNDFPGEDIRSSPVGHSTGDVGPAEHPVGEPSPHREPPEPKARRAAPLTPRQREILDFFVERIRSEGLPPTVREVAARFGIALNAVRHHLQALVKKNWLRQSKVRRRYVPRVNRTCPCCGRKVRS